MSNCRVPLVEQLDASNLGSNLLGQDFVARDGLDFDFSWCVGHDGGVVLIIRSGRVVVLAFWFQKNYGGAGPAGHELRLALPYF